MDFLRSYNFIVLALLSAGHLQSSLFGGFVVAPTKKLRLQMVNLGLGQLTKVHTGLNNFLRYPYFSI